jgi:hypothetical protein
MFSRISDLFFDLKTVFWGVQSEQLAPQMPLVYRYNKRDPQKLVNKFTRMYDLVVHDIGLPNYEYIQFTRPILTWLSEYLILLPASEHYHHIEPGAFYLHCVQTANKAVQLSSNNTTLFFNVPAEDRDEYQRNFYYAAWLGGILHDIGKPIVDLNVYAVDRSQKWIKNIPSWNPLEKTLHQWCLEHNVRWYRAVFVRDKEKEKHEIYATTFINKLLSLIPDNIIDKRAVFEFLISINNPVSKLHGIVKKADSMSTRHDIQRYDKVGVFNTPIFHFIRSLVDYEFEHSGSHLKPYFVSEIGIHITYPRGMKTIISYLFAGLTSEEIQKLNIVEDIGFWINMLRNHRFLVIDVDSYKDTTGQYPENSQYIYDVSYIEQGQEFNQTCITLTKDTRVPLSVEPNEYKRVNLVKIDNNHLNTPSNHSVDINNESMSSIGSEKSKPYQNHRTTSARVRTSPEPAQTEDLLDVDVSINTNEKLAQVVHEQPIDSPVDDKPIKQINLSDLITNKKTLLQEQTSINDLDFNVDLNVDDIEVEPIKEDIKEDLVEEKIDIGIDLNKVKSFLEKNCSDHIVYKSLRQEMLDDYCYLLVFLIEVYEMIEQGIYNPIKENKVLFLDKSGLNISLIYLNVERVFIQKFGLSKAQITRVKKYLALFRSQSLPSMKILFQSQQGGYFVFNHDIAKILCYPIRQQVIKLVQQGEVYLPIKEQ